MAAILDHTGQPIRKEALTEPQTSRLGHLASEFENHPSRGLTPARLASILEGAERGNLVAQAELFADMEEKDAHIFSEMSKRKRALLKLDWQVVPPRNATAEEKKEAEWLTEKLLDIANLEDVMLDALDGIGYAYSCQELEWELVEREWMVKEFSHRSPTWFCLDPNNRNHLLLRTQGTEGEPLREFGWLTHVHRAKSGYLARSGLHRVLAWPFLFKNYSVRDLAEFLEIYGLPMRLGKYPRGANPEEKATLLRAVTMIGHAAGGIIPEGMSIEFENAASGQSDPFMAMIDWAERSQSKAIVGQTTSAEAKNTGLGSGVANLHGDVRNDLTVSDAKQLASTLTALGQMYVTLNRGQRDPRRICRVVFDTGEAEDMKLFSEALPKLVSIGMRVPASYAHSKLRIPEPKADEQVLTAPAKEPAANPPATDAALAMLTAALRNTPPTEDPLEDLAGEMADEWEETLAPMIGPLERLAQECKTLEEFRERLPMVLEQMDTAVMAELIAQGNFAALVWGRVGSD